MNKKVLTLCAGFLLAGSLTAFATDVTKDQFINAIGEGNVLSIKNLKKSLEEAGKEWDGKIELTQNVDLTSGEGAKKYVILGSDAEGVTLTSTKDALASGGKMFTGNIVVAAEDVTISTLKIKNAPEAGIGGYWQKAAVSVFADNITITNNQISAGTDAEGALSNGIMLFPQTKEATYSKITGNTLSGFDAKVDLYYSSAIQVYQAAPGENKMGDPLADTNLLGVGENDATATPDALNMTALNNNTFSGNSADIFVRTNNEWTEDGEGSASTTVYARIDNVESEDALKDAIVTAGSNATIVVENSTASEVQKFVSGLGAATLNGLNVAIVADGGNVILGNASAPDNGQESVVAGIDQVASDADQPIVGSIDANTYYLLSGGGSFLKYDGETLTTTQSTTDADALWKVSVTKYGDLYRYVFTNKNGKVLEVEGMDAGNSFIGAAYSKSGILLKNSDGEALGWSSNAYAMTSTTSEQKLFALYEAGDITFTADELNEILKPGFGMTIKIAENNDKEIEGVEVFGKTMYAVATSSNAVKVVDKLNENGTVAEDANYLVLDKEGWDGISANSQLNGEFIWVSAEDLADAELNKNWYDEFEFRYSAGKPDTDILETLYVPGVGASAYVLSVNGINYLTTKTNISGTETWPYIKLAPQNIVDVKTLLGKYWNITFAEKTVSNPNEEYKLNNGVVAVIQREGETAPKADYVKASSVLLTSPETQWAVVSVSGSTFTLQNRENPNVKIEGVTLRYDDATKLYTIYTSNSNLDGDVVKLASHTITGTLHMDGFMTAKPAELRDKVFHIGQYHYETGNSTAFWAENHQANRSHQLGVVTDEETAVDWRLSIEMQKDRKGLETADADTMYVITKLAALNGNGGIDNYKAADTLAILQYKFQNKGNLEYVIFNDAANQKYYQCQEDKSDESTALHFALKLKPDSTYNVVSVVENKGKRADALGAEKIYVANSQQWGSLKQMPTYGEDNNSLMQVIPVDRPEYRKVEMAWGDTIKLWRNENESQVVYEKRDDKSVVEGDTLSFLNIDNDNQFNMNPAIFADTAYINRWDVDGVKNTCYQYLLAVNPSNVSEYYCPLTPEHNTDAWREAHGGPCPDADKSAYVEGRFLVNLIDTANVYGLEHLHNNPYINLTEEGNYCAKLSFVPGKHMGDSLVIYRDEAMTDVIDTLYLGTGDFNVAKFAFKYVDNEEGSFKIQTQWKEYLGNNTSMKDTEDFVEHYEDYVTNKSVSNEGYLRFVNGCLVVDKNFSKGDVFNMTERYTAQAPTANEEITAENAAVSVVATDGAVIIKGAAGKNVVIATILGKVVANETINSDNETIAVPAGIAVVSVDGESFKVVVK